MTPETSATVSDRLRPLARRHSEVPAQYARRHAL